MKTKYSLVDRKNLSVKTMLNQTYLEGAKASGVCSFSYLLLLCYFVNILAVCLSPNFAKHFSGEHFLGKKSQSEFSFKFNDKLKLPEIFLDTRKCIKLFITCMKLINNIRML